MHKLQFVLLSKFNPASCNCGVAAAITCEPEDSPSGLACLLYDRYQWQVIERIQRRFDHQVCPAAGQHRVGITIPTETAILNLFAERFEGSIFIAIKEIG